MNQPYHSRLSGLFLPLIAFFCSSLASASADWQLVWSDEFNLSDGSPPDSGNWNYDIGTGDWGWGNNEMQYYTSRLKNARIENGMLIIEAHEENYGGKNHTSARLKTEGKWSWEYGKIEARVKVPSGTGLWPAVWMLGTDIPSVGWPQCGEIDIMEFVGREPYEIFGTVHGPGYSGGQAVGRTIQKSAPISDDFHVFAVEWEENEIRWYFDGEEYFKVNPSDLGSNQWVFDHEFFLILNLAIGGNFGGTLDPNLSFPRQMLVDYVRVYKYEDATGNTLQNSGFESGSLSSWQPIGNTGGANAEGGYIESDADSYYNAGQPNGDPVMIRNGEYVAKVYGDFTGSLNDNGFEQVKAAEPGTLWQAEGWALTHQQDLMQGSTSANIIIQFRDNSGQDLATYVSDPLQPSDPPGVWKRLVVNNDQVMIAPTGSTQIAYTVRFRQSNYDAGSAYFDDLLLKQVTSEYAAWASSYNLGENAGFDADPDNDGKKNGIENIFGTDPSVPDTQNLVIIDARANLSNSPNSHNILDAAFNEGSSYWTPGGSNVNFSYPSSGGNPDNYAVISHSSPGWGIFVTHNEEIISLDSLGMSPGSTYSFFVDMKIETNSPNNTIGGFKVDFFNGSTLANTTGDLRPQNQTGSTTWQTYTFPVSIPYNTDGVKLVLLWGENSTVGYDNLRYQSDTTAFFSFTHPHNENHSDDITFTYKWSDDLENFYSSNDQAGQMMAHINDFINYPTAGITMVNTTVTGEVPEKLFLTIEAINN